MILYLNNFVCPITWSETTALAKRMSKEADHKYRTAPAERNLIQIDVGTRRVLAEV